MVGAGTAGVTADCDSDMRVSSEANPGIRILWFRSAPNGEQHHRGQQTSLPRCNCKSLTSRVSPPRCLASRHPKLVTESINSSATCRSNCTSCQSWDTTRTWATYILDLGFDPHVRVDARDQVLYRSSHALIARCILPPCPTVIERERGRIIAPRDLRGRPCSRHQDQRQRQTSRPVRTDLTFCHPTDLP